MCAQGGEGAQLALRAYRHCPRPGAASSRSAHRAVGIGKRPRRRDLRMWSLSRRRPGLAIVVAESGAGTHPAQNTVTNAHIEFEPELQIFVGIGGSRKEDVPVGSVVAADHVYMPYGGKYGEKGFSARPREFAADPQLLEVARKVRRDKNGSNGFATPRIASCRSSTNTQ